MFRSRKQNRRKKSPKQRKLKRREAIQKWIRRTGLGLALAAVAVGLPALIFWGYSQLMESEYFSLTYVDVEGLQYLEEDALLEAAENVGGEHILNVQPQRLETTMRSLPFVEDVDVERRFPDRLHIVINEYDPQALVVDEGFWLADASGQVFLEFDSTASGDDLWALPMITGLSRADLETDQGREHFRQALKVYKQYGQRGLDENMPVSEIHVDDVLGVSLVVGETGTEVRLGWGRWEQRLERLEVVQTSLIRRGVDAAYVLIDHENDLSRIAVGQRTGPGNGEVQESEF